MNLTPTDFYRTHATNKFVLIVPCPSQKHVSRALTCQKVYRKHGNNDAWSAHAHAKFGSRINENFLSTTKIP